MFIAHRGNTDGPSDHENELEYMKHAYNMGYGVECDIQLFNNKLYFGHDEPQSLIDYRFITSNNVFCHAKSVEVLPILLNLGVNCFFHVSDEVTLTRGGQIWCYPGVHPRNENAIWLDLHSKPLPDDVDGIYGICGDYVR
jgi:hypothetical protein